MTFDLRRVVVTRYRPGPALRCGAVAALAVCACAWAIPASAQSLGELAKQEEARRKAIKAPAKVYTNSSLAPVPGEVIPTPSRATPESAQPPADPDAEPAPPENPAAAEALPPDVTSTPEYWRQRMANAVLQRDRAAVMLEALQSRINALLADFTARDDPAQRAVIANNRQKALDELARLQHEQVGLEKAIADIDEEARRARIPPGWLR